MKINVRCRCGRKKQLPETGRLGPKSMFDQWLGRNGQGASGQTRNIWWRTRGGFRVPLDILLYETANQRIALDIYIKPLDLIRRHVARCCTRNISSSFFLLPHPSSASPSCLCVYMHVTSHVSLTFSHSSYVRVRVRLLLVD